MSQPTKELGRLRDKLAALEEEEQHAVGLGTVESKESIYGAVGVDASHCQQPSPTRAHTTYIHFVKEHLTTTDNHNIINKNDNITTSTTPTIDDHHITADGHEPPSSMLSHELARLKIEHDVWHLRGPHLEARYADAAARIATRSATLKASLSNWGVVGLECPPLAVPAIQRPSTFSTSISAHQHTSPPKLWLRSVHGPDTTNTPPPTTTDSTDDTTTITSSPSPSHQVCASQRGQVATSEAVQCYIGLERLREEVGYWKLLDSVLNNTLIPEEKRIELGFRDVLELERLAGSIRRTLWDGVWLRVTSAIQSEQQRIQMFMTHVPTTKIGAASTTCADAAKLATRDAEKRTLYALQLHHYKSLDILSHIRTASSSPTTHSPSRTIIASRPPSSPPSTTTSVALPVVRIGGVDEGDVPLYPLTACMDPDLLDKLIHLAEATVWLQSIPTGEDNEEGANTKNDDEDDENTEFSRHGISAVLHLRDGVERRIQSNRSKPPTPSSTALRRIGNGTGGGCRRSFTALPEVYIYLHTLEEQVNEVLGILRSEGERGVASSVGGDTPRWFVGSHDKILTTSNSGISSPMAIRN